MIIELREPALEKINKLPLGDSEGIRILTDVEESCTLFTDYQLKIDAKKESDTVIVAENIPFLIAEKAKGALPDHLYITYSAPGGYKLFTDEGILKANMSISK